MEIALVLIIYRTNSDSAKETALFCEKVLKNKKIKSLQIDSNFNEKLLKSLLENNSSLPDLAIVLGGDGTVLKSANELVTYNIPIISFNIGGNLGFLTHDKKFLFDESFIDLLQTDQFKINFRTMLKCNVFRNLMDENKVIKLKEYNALNDFYFKSIEDDITPTNQIQIEINSEKVNEYKGDGLIIASATGSTAYSMAAGGPIIHPMVNAFVINPICPMSLSSRPIIVPDDSKVTIRAIKKNKRSLILWRDGSKCITIKQSDFCEIIKGEKPSKMLSFSKSISYYSTLIKKLKWEGNLSNKNNGDY